MVTKQETHNDIKKLIKTGFAINAIIGLVIIWAICFFNPRRLEATKAWWQENFKLAKQLYATDARQSQQKTVIQQTLTQMWGVVIDTENNEKDDTSAIDNTSTKENTDMIKIYKEIVSDAHIIGNKKARITILEYSELLCPYCQRQHADGNLQKIVEKYPDEVNTTFRHFIVHDQATKYAMIAECATDQDGSDGFNNFIHEAFKVSSVNDSNISDIIKNANLDEKKINECVESEKYKDKVMAQTQEGRNNFGVKGTPGNVIIDLKTGKFVLIPGAYPFEKFDEEVQKLLAN